MEIAILAALSMLVQDISEAIKIIALSRNRGWSAGVTDAIMWLMALFSLGEALQHKGTERYEIIVLVTIANVLGQKIGQVIGNKIIKEEL
jgi:hypothetical protein